MEEKKKGRPFRGEHGGSRRRIGAASCSQSRARQRNPDPPRAVPTLQARPRVVAVVVLLSAVDSLSPLAPGARARHPQPHPRRVQNLLLPSSARPRSSRGLERSIPLLTSLVQRSSWYLSPPPPPLPAQRDPLFPRAPRHKLGVTLGTGTQHWSASQRRLLILGSRDRLRWIRRSQRNSPGDHRCLAARGSSGGAEKVRRLGLVVGGWVRGGGT